MVFGGAGRSYDRNLFDYMGLEQVKAALATYKVNFVETSGCTPAPGTCVPWDASYLNGIETLRGIVDERGRNGEIDLLNNDLVTPYSDQYSLGIRGTWSPSDVRCARHTESISRNVYSHQSPGCSVSTSCNEGWRSNTPPKIS